jgi:hypothetical protein
LDSGYYGTSIAIDSNDKPHIAYEEYDGKDVKYAKNTTGTWTTEIAFDGSLSYDGYYLMDRALALDSNDYAHIAYRQANDYLGSAHYNGTGWVTEDVDYDGTTGMYYTSVAVDASDHPHIAYYDGNNYDLKYATWDGAAWDIQTVDSDGSTGYYTSIALDASGNPHIAYYRSTNSELAYATWDGAAWDLQTIDSDNTVGYYPSIALDSGGSPHISYGEYTNDILRYAYYYVATNDIIVDSINYPTGAVPSGTHQVDATVRNGGTATQTSIPVNCKIYRENIHLSEDFETWPPGGWTIESYAPGANWTQAGSSGDYYAFADEDLTTEASDEWLISPTINLASASGTQLSFWVDFYDSSASGDSFGEVMGSIDDGASWTQLIANWTEYADNEIGDKVYDISSWADGQSLVKIRFRFYSTNTTSAYDDFSVDDVLVSSFSLEYNDDETIASLAPDASTNVLFSPSWTVSTGGNFIINVTASNPGDEIPQNDFQEIPLVVEDVHDMGTVSINSPTGLINTGTYAANATIKNFGTITETDVPVNCSIYKFNTMVYEDFDVWPPSGWTIENHAPGVGWAQGTSHDGACAFADEVTTTTEQDTWLITPTLNLAGASGTHLAFWMDFYDSSVSGDSFGEVMGSIDDGASWTQLIANWTEYAENEIDDKVYDISSWADGQSQVKIRFRFYSTNLTSAYDDFSVDDVHVYYLEFDYGNDKTITLDAGQEGYVIFNEPWTVTEEAFYLINVSTQLIGDEDNGNDAQETIVQVDDFHDVETTSINNPLAGLHPTGIYTVNTTVTNNGNVDETNVPVNCSIYKFDQVLFEDFEGVTTPGFPAGWVVEDTNADAKEWYTYSSSTYAHSGTKSARYPYHTSNAADDWLFTPALSLSSGETYELSFWYRAYSSSYPEAMDVWIGTAADSGSMTTVLWNNSVITNTVYAEATTPVSVSTGTYYIGFHCYSDINQYYLHVDDVGLAGTTYTLAYGDDVNIGSLPIGESVFVEFDPWDVSQVADEGDYVINVTAQLGADEDPTNDFKETIVSINDLNDVGTTSINDPSTGTYNTGTMFTVNATVENFGNLNQTDVPVNCSIYKVVAKANVLVFGDDVIIGSLPIDGSAFVEFDPWTATEEADFIIEVTTQLGGDENPGNDVQSVALTIDDLHDVGVDSINYPTGIQSRGTHTVNATIENYGDQNETSIPVHVSIHKINYAVSLLDEDFEGTFPPAGWTIINNGGDCIWERNDITGRINYAGGDGYCAIADVDDCGSGTTMDTELHSPMFNLATPLDLTYVTSYNWMSSLEWATVDISTDGGTNWIELLNWSADHDPYGPGEEVTISLAPYVGNASCVLRWHYYAPGWYYYWEIDQVKVAAPADLVLVYEDDETIPSLTAGTSTFVEFDPAWTVLIEGDYLVNVTTNLAGDENAANDFQEIVVEINDIQDVGTVSIDYPTGTKGFGTHAVSATVENYGNVNQKGNKVSFPVNCTIYNTTQSTLFEDDFEAKSTGSGTPQVPNTLTISEPTLVTRDTSSGGKPLGGSRDWILYPTDSVWHLQEYRSASPTHSYYCGNDTTHQYENSEYDWIWREISLAGVSDVDNVHLVFNLWLDTEAGYDYLKFGFGDDNTSFWVYSIDGNSSGWVEVEVSMVDDPGWYNPTTMTTWLGFLFDTDTSGNTWEGAYFDDVKIIDTASVGTMIYSDEETVTSLDAGASTSVEFNPPWTIYTEGDYIIEVTTLLPSDENTGNDQQSTIVTIDNKYDVGTESINFPVHQETYGVGNYTVNATILNNYYNTDKGLMIPVNCTIKEAMPGYSYDFESDNGGFTASADWSPYTGDWEYTDSYDVSGYAGAHTPPPTAHSGDGMWGTIIYDDYTNAGGESWLNKTVDLTGISDSQLTFYSWSDIFGSFDYGMVRVNGVELLRIDDYNPTAWTFETVNLAAYDGTTIELSFAFYATTVVEYAGWYIDDVEINSATRAPGDIVYTTETSLYVDSLSTADIEFTPPWDAAPGNYTVEVITLLAGDEVETNNKTTIFVTITADAAPPAITDVIVIASDPLDEVIGWEHFYATVTDDVGVDTVQLNLTYTDGHTEYHAMTPVGDIYSFNTTLTVPGGDSLPGYTYHIYATDTFGKESMSTPAPFALPMNEDVNEDGKAHFMDLVAVSLAYNDVGPNGWIREDVNNDGKAHFMDLVAVSLAYNEVW